MKQTNDRFECTPLGDSALILTFGQRLDKVVNARVHQFAQAIAEENLSAVVDLVPAYTTLTVFYDPSSLDLETGEFPYQMMCQKIEKIAANLRTASECESRLIEIPVCYEGELAPDIEYVARHTGLSIEDIIARHSSATYQVYFLGFTPGFPYLGGMDLQLATPRLVNPRTSIPAGSVGIAGEQTGVYPLETPGGWQLIGRTPLKLVDLTSDSPTLLQAGDKVRFHPISKAEFYEWESVL